MAASTATSAGEQHTPLTLLHGYCSLHGLLRLAAFVRDTRSPCIHIPCVYRWQEMTAEDMWGR